MDSHNPQSAAIEMHGVNATLAIVTPHHKMLQKRQMFWTKMSSKWVGMRGSCEGPEQPHPKEQQDFLAPITRLSCFLRPFTGQDTKAEIPVPFSNLQILQGSPIERVWSSIQAGPA